MNLHKVVLFGIGVVSGAVLAGIATLLLSPDSGNAIRRQAREQFDDLLDDAQSAAEARRTELETQLADLIRS